MSVGGQAPVDHLLMLIRSAPPARAVTMLVGLPSARLGEVVAALGPNDIAKLIPVAPRDLVDRLVGALSPQQLVHLAGMLPETIAPALAALPADLLAEILNAVPESALADLLASLPPLTRDSVFSVLDPARVRLLQTPAYERQVAEALRRGNSTVSQPAGGPPGILLVRTLNWVFAVAPRAGDDGRVALRDAEQAAPMFGVNGALAITDRPPAADVAHYCRSAQHRGVLVDAVIWNGPEHDNLLKRTLVGLCR